jgi:hypothetical protein
MGLEIDVCVVQKREGVPPSPALVKTDIFLHSPRLCGQLGLALAKRLRKAYQFLPQMGASLMLHNDFRHQGR